MFLSLISLTHAKSVEAHPALEVQIGGEVVELTRLSTEVHANLDGDVANVLMVQTFENPSTESLDARYVFPLPSDAAVHAMRFTAGEMVVEARIADSEEARVEFIEADEAGKQATLLEQHRPNVFTQAIANLPPGETISVTLEYAHTVERTDGVYSWHLPIEVGPRYGSQIAPSNIEPDAISVEVQLDAGMAVASVGSLSHSLTSHAAGDVWTLKLDDEPIPNDDLVLDYRLAGATPAVGVRTDMTDGHGVISLLVEPPRVAADETLSSRELVFLLDTSCSMSGDPMKASKRFMTEALRGMREGDVFRIHRFGTETSSLADAALPATPENIARGIEYVDELSGNGGTNMDLGIRAALEPAPVDDTLRTVVFLTDGYIGNDFDILELVDEKRGEARIHALGVGGNVNRYLLEEIGRAGRGTTRIVLPTEDPVAAAEALVERLSSPYLTDLRIDWGTAPVQDVTPRVLPDLYLGDSLRVMARIDRPGDYDITLLAEVAGRPAALPATLHVPADTEGRSALPIIWARSQVTDRMIDWASARATAVDKARLKDEIRTLGLEYGLVTQWTSFVAVAEREVVADVQRKAATPTFSGGSAPEPAEWAVLGMLALMSMLVFRRKEALSR
ncbi:MAG: VWA domain-containing protein [Proteobacteria bacterium]|nr:VWA domain-containing protein [Pseudomonadota bacterium]MCP4921474.1 VWA domain-containing protein [Pseudomonadota bacterium]